MKKFILPLFVVFVLSMAFNTSKTNELVNLTTSIATQTKYIGEVIESTDTITNEVIFANLNGNNNQQLLYIYVDSTNSGTLSFSLNVPMDNWLNDSTQIDSLIWKQWNAGSQLQMTVNNNSKNLYFKASATGQKFVVYN